MSTKKNYIKKSSQQQQKKIKGKLKILPFPIKKFPSANFLISFFFPFHNFFIFFTSNSLQLLSFHFSKKRDFFLLLFLNFETLSRNIFYSFSFLSRAYTEKNTQLRCERLWIFSAVRVFVKWWDWKKGMMGKVGNYGRLRVIYSIFSIFWFSAELSFIPLEMLICSFWVKLS